MVSCDICGKLASMQAVVEGATMDVCLSCSRFGKSVSRPASGGNSGNSDNRGNFGNFGNGGQSGHQQFQRQQVAETEVRLVSGFGKLIASGREEAGFSRVDLAKKLNMRELDLLHFEEEKFKPTEGEAKRLESVLKIKLVGESKTANDVLLRPKMSMSGSKTLTLADVVVIKDKRK